MPDRPDGQPGDVLLADIGRESGAGQECLGLVHSAETGDIEVEAVSYAEARAAIEAQVPEGWQVLSFREPGGRLA